MSVMCLDGLMCSDTSDEGLGDETLCAVGYSDAPRLIKLLGGIQVAPPVSCLEDKCMFSYKRGQQGAIFLPFHPISKVILVRIGNESEIASNQPIAQCLGVILL